MELAEVEPFLQKLGLIAQINPAAYRKQIRVLGEINYDELLGLEVGGWICYGWQEEGCWVVETPPILIPGPGPLYQAQSLEEAVHLIAYVFEHRQEIRTAEGQESYDLACRLNEKFQDEWEFSPKMNFRHYLADSLDQEIENKSFCASRVFLNSFQLVSAEESETGQSKVPPIALVAFRGTYQDGSLGKPDALNMISCLKSKLTAQPFSAVILDFSLLRYEWGDNLGQVILYPRVIGPPKVPITMVVSSKCAPAIRTLRPFYASMMLSLPDDEWIHETQAAAIQYVRQKLKTDG